MATTTIDVQDNHELPDQALVRAVARHELHLAVRHALPDLEYRVLVHLYGLDGTDGGSYAAVAETLALTVGQVKRCREVACRRLALVPGLKELFFAMCQDHSLRQTGQSHEIRRGE